MSLTNILTRIVILLCIFGFFSLHNASAQSHIDAIPRNQLIWNTYDSFLYSDFNIGTISKNKVGAYKRNYDKDHTHDGLHFSHPLVTESVSPDTKLRFDYDFGDLEGDATENGIGLEGEYAFHRSFSIEIGVPYVFANPEAGSADLRLGNIEVGLKFANYAFEDAGLLLGYGMEFGLPTGDDDTGIGSDNIIELEPFLNLGLKTGKWEWIGFAKFGIPTNQDPGQEIETEFGLNLSSLYHVTDRVQALLELDGEAVLSGEEAGEESEYFLTPGFKVTPFSHQQFRAGAGLRFPLSKDTELQFMTLVSLFYHF